jgi:hypothetical protein
VRGIYVPYQFIIMVIIHHTLYARKVYHFSFCRSANNRGFHSSTTSQTNLFAVVIDNNSNSDSSTCSKTDFRWNFDRPADISGLFLGWCSVHPLEYGFFHFFLSSSGSTYRVPVSLPGNYCTTVPLPGEPNAP